MRIPLPAVVLVSLALATLASAQTHADYRLEAEAAYKRKDYPAALAATKDALALRPDSPRYLHNLAALSALTGDAASAYGYLRKLGTLGVVTAIERDPDLASIQGTPEFRRILDQFATNREPRGEAHLFAELAGRTGIVEGIAVRARTGDLFFGDVHHRCIWRRDRAGELTRFTAENEELFGVMGLALDEARNTLWAATSALPEMIGFEPAMKGHAAIAEFDLSNGELRRIIPVPDDGRQHTLGDLCLAPDGTVYATDSASPIVWKLIPDAEEPQKLVDDPAFGSLQGLVLDQGKLLVSDYSNGLCAIDLATGTITVLQPPENFTLLGIDGLATIPGGLVATQNGVTPQRVLRLTLSPALDKIEAVQVLASGQPDLTDLTLITILENRPTFIAGSGWDAVSAKAKQPAAHPVRLFQVEVK
ncbi:MAG: hypothetical protein V4773_28210 [Verrucomicrobiota bacterium]